jgi:transketolase
VPHQVRDAGQVDAIRRGGYVLFDSDGAPDCVLIATGSEVGLAMEAARLLAAEGHRARVVSMPCVSVFAAQDRAWQDAVLPPGVERRVAVEAGVTESWWRWVGTKGRVVGIDRFGASAPAKDLFRHYGLTAEAVAGAARELLAG